MFRPHCDTHANWHIGDCEKHNQRNGRRKAAEANRHFALLLSDFPTNLASANEKCNNKKGILSIQSVDYITTFLPHLALCFPSFFLAFSTRQQWYRSCYCLSCTVSPPRSRVSGRCFTFVCWLMHGSTSTHNLPDSADCRFTLVLLLGFRCYFVCEIIKKEHHWERARLELPQHECTAIQNILWRSGYRYSLPEIFTDLLRKALEMRKTLRSLRFESECSNRTCIEWLTKFLFACRIFVSIRVRFHFAIFHFALLFCSECNMRTSTPKFRRGTVELWTMPTLTLGRNMLRTSMTISKFPKLRSLL